MAADLISNEAWLAGYASYRRGDPIPWGDSTPEERGRRQGWLAARADGARP